MGNYSRISIAALTVMAVVTLTQGAMALQGENPRQPRQGFTSERAAGRLAERLNLTDEQKSRVQSYLEDQRSQVQALRDNTSLSQEQRRSQAQAIRQQTRDKIESILTVEQRQKAEDLRMQAVERQNDRREFAARELGRQLNLTDDQKSKVQSFLQEERSQLQTLRNDSSLTQEQKLQKMRDIRQQTQSSVRGILTPDQQTKLDQLRQRAQDRARRRTGRFGGMRRRGPGAGL